MGRFLYFFPGLQSAGQITAELKAECGLERVLIESDGLDHVQVIGAGPGGNRGILCAPSQEGAPHLTCKPTEQNWRECADGLFWLGYETLPTAAELWRKRERPCFKWVVNVTGGPWVIPAVHVHGEKVSTYLPERIDVDRSGNRIHVPVPRYRPLIEFATEAMKEFDRAETEGVNTFEFTEDFLYAASLEALATHYRVSKWEVAALGILETPTMIEIVQALCDEGTRREMMLAKIDAQKKTEVAATAGT